MLWLEEKYINLLGPRLKLFKKLRPNLWSFRCPICGDSKKDPHKSRGGFYVPPKGTSYNMGCFNCGASMSFVNFLKITDTYLYDEFIMERYEVNQDAKQVSKPVTDKVPEKKRVGIRDLERLDTLDNDHPAVKYLLKRKIDPKHFDRLYFVLGFKQWEANFRGLKIKVKEDHPRLVIPFFDTSGNITRLSARAFGNETPKYIYMKVMDNASRVYGLDTVNANKRVYVLEGPLDSLFIENAIATGSADLIVPELENFKDRVLVPDNQPRNKEVCKVIKKMVDSGEKVCLWNEYWGKDINDAVKNGHTPEEIRDLIDRSTVSGISAQLKFSQWVKVTV